MSDNKNRRFAFYAIVSTVASAVPVWLSPVNDVSISIIACLIAAMLLTTVAALSESFAISTIKNALIEQNVTSAVARIEATSPVA